MKQHDGLDVARVLLRKAGQDETLVRKIGSDPDIADEIIGFHAQQAVEKAIKAVLTAHKIPFMKTHELSYLVGSIEDNKIDAPSVLEQVDTLSPWAVEFRYPGEDPPALDRAAALGVVVKVREWAEAQIAAIPSEAKAAAEQEPSTESGSGQSSAPSS